MIRKQVIYGSRKNPSTVFISSKDEESVMKRIKQYIHSVHSRVIMTITVKNFEETVC